MNTTFIITGGAGRVTASIPALEKYHRLNPKDNFSVIVHGWESLFWSHPILQKRTFGAHQKGLFDSIIRKNKIVSPEPYHLNNFFNQRISLIEAFDEIINKTKKHDDLSKKPNLYLTEFEHSLTKDWLTHLKTEQKKRKIVLFQPFGSSVQAINKQPIDPSNRSLELKDYMTIVKSMEKDAVILFASHPQFRHPQDTYTVSFDDRPSPYLRTLMSIAANADLFVGIDSVGQYVARAFDLPGIVIMGATNDINFSFPDFFTIFRNKDKKPIYSPWRLIDTECEFSDRENDGIMKFSEEQMKELTGLISQSLGKSTIEHIGSVGLSYS
jgi:hypothetical protein